MVKTLKFIALAVAVFFGLGIMKNSVCQGFIVQGLSAAIRMPVSIGKTDVSFLRSSARLENFRINNTAGFHDKTMLEMPLIYFSFDPAGLLKGVVHFREVTLNLKEFIVVKNSSGKINIDSMKPAAASGTSAGKKQKDAGAPAKSPKFRIDKLTLSIGRVVYKDYSGAGAPVVQSFDVNIKDATYANVDDPATLVSLIMFDALTRTSLSRFANLDISFLGEGSSKALSRGLATFNEQTKNIEEKAKNLLSIFDK